MLSSPPDNVHVSLPSESNLSDWEVTITGPENTPYAGGKFMLSFSFPETYPFKPPKIAYKTKIYHPNIKSDTGEICTSILYDDWAPTLNVTHCLDALFNMMKCPTADSPLEESIANILRDKPKEFEKNARKWTKEHAM
jgi:ubiquitin-conjugating enzyme E2 D/E